MGGAAHHRRLVIGRHAHATGRRRHDAAPAWRATRNRAPARPPRAESPSARRRAAPRPAASSAGRSATAQPPFCGSSPILTWTKQSGRRPAFAIASASACDQRRPVDAEWIASNKATASSALFDCSRPIRCSRTLGISRAKGRPFRLRLLHPVLAEIALAGGDQRRDRFRRLGFGDRDQGDVIGLAAGQRRRLADPRPAPSSRDETAIGPAIGRAMLAPPASPAPVADDRRAAGRRLLGAVARLPRGAGVVFRHLQPGRRRGGATCSSRVRAIARRAARCCCWPGRRACAAPGAPTAATAAGPAPASGARRCTTLREIRAAERDGADHALPVARLPDAHATPARRPLGPVRFAWLCAPHAAAGHRARRDEPDARARDDRRSAAYGWAGIDALRAEAGGRLQA